MKRTVLILPVLLIAGAAWASEPQAAGMAEPDADADAEAEAGLPDLVVELKEPMMREFIVRNVGSAAAGASTVSVGCGAITLTAEPPTARCVTGAEYKDYSTPGINTVARLDVEALGPGESVMVKVPYWTDIQLKEEIGFTFLIQADADNQIQESDEDNNSAESFRGDAPASR